MKARLVGPARVRSEDLRRDRLVGPVRLVSLQVSRRSLNQVFPSAARLVLTCRAGPA